MREGIKISATADEYLRLYNDCCADLTSGLAGTDRGCVEGQESRAAAAVVE